MRERRLLPLELLPPLKEKPSIETRFSRELKTFLIQEAIANGFLCPLCNEPIEVGQDINVHHIIFQEWVSEIGLPDLFFYVLRKPGNAVVMHKICHDSFHNHKEVTLAPPYDVPGYEGLNMLPVFRHFALPFMKVVEEKSNELVTEIEKQSFFMRLPRDLIYKPHLFKSAHTYEQYLAYTSDL